MSGGKAVPGDADFPYMLADTPEEFDRVRRIGAPAPSPAAEPPEGLRMTALVRLTGALRDMQDRYENGDWSAWNWRSEADALLAGPLAAVLAQAATDRAAVERVRAEIERLIPLGYINPYYGADHLRRALDDR